MEQQLELSCLTKKELNADYIIPAVSPDVLLNQFLEGKYPDPYFKERFADRQVYQLLSTTVISLGVDADISKYPHSLCIEMKHPLKINNTAVSSCSVYHYCFEPSFSPQGKSLIEVNLEDSEFEFWQQLKATSVNKYKNLKEKLGDSIICEIGIIYPELKGKIEILDVATPLTFYRYTNTYQGSYMSFCMTPGSKMQNHKGVIDGIKNMYLAGQWVLPQGGLPIAVIAGKFAVQRMYNNYKHRKGL